MKSKMEKKVVIWGGWYGSHNVGDQVLLLSITDLLEKHLDHPVSFTVLTDNAAWVREYMKRQSTCKIIAVQSRREITRVLRAVKESDMFLVGGGVPFFDQTYHVMVMGFLFALARLWQKPYMFWSVSSLAIRSGLARAVFRWVLGKASAITYRDQHTRELFISCGVKPNQMKIAPDSGFTLEWNAESESSKLLERAGWEPGGRPLFGLTPRVLRSKDGEAETHYEVKTLSQYKQELACFAGALDWLWEQGYQPVFIPMNTAPPDDDRLASRAVIQQAKHGEKALMIDEQVKPRVAPALYSLCTGSLVARVHGSITAMLGNCPMVMYAFAQKHAGIMDSIQMQEYCISEESATPSKTTELIARLLDQRQEIQERLSTLLEQLKLDATIPARQAAEILKCEYKI